MEYNFATDVKTIRSIRNLTQEDLASAIDVEQVTISRSETGVTSPSPKLLERTYSFAFKNGVRLNALKEMFWREDIPQDHKLLFHGAKSEITGDISLDAGRLNNDFGQGFYTGETYEQAVSFISAFDQSSVYMLDFNPTRLVSREYSVNQEWMMTIAYYRGRLDAYSDHPKIKRLIEKSRDCDYIIAPIADNRMFQIINSFIDGEITDQQCKHCLAATNLGMQYIFTTQKAIDNLTILERCYVPDNEKKYYVNQRTDVTALGEDKVKMARIKYRGQGKYIDEILV
ncbi:MAG: DUF3990 domain-containing protein [Eubacterium sp.]|nr:DUF3990 domain-containing protein [Candidatus Colimonas fimequi]